MSESCPCKQFNKEKQLEVAKQYIDELKEKLRQKELEINEHVRRWQFYEQIVKNLTTFK